MGGARSCGNGYGRGTILRERLWEGHDPAGPESSGWWNSRTLPGAISWIISRGLRSLWSLTHGYENLALRAAGVLHFAFSFKLLAFSS